MFESKWELDTEHLFYFEYLHSRILKDATYGFFFYYIICVLFIVLKDYLYSTLWVNYLFLGLAMFGCLMYVIDYVNARNKLFDKFFINPKWKGSN